MKKLFRERRFDVIHTHAPYNPGFVMLAPFAAPSSAITVGTFHSVFSPGPLLDVFGRAMRTSIGRLDGKVVVSEACIGSLVPYFPYDYTVIPNGIDERHFTPDADPIEHLRDGRMNILFLGRFDPRNGLGTMIDAFVRVRREWGPEVRLVVVGDGPLRSYYQKRVPGRHAGRRPLGRPGRLGAAALLHQCRCPLHAVQSGVVRHGAARGDELRPPDRRESHLRASSSSWSTASTG